MNQGLALLAGWLVLGFMIAILLWYALRDT
jgi:hypothetical protein